MQVISVLVADDDPNIRRCLRHAMEIDPKFRVMWEAENGLQALALAGQHRPDLILMDAQMPRMDGIEALRCLRQHHIAGHVIVMSVYEQVRSQALEAGADAFFRKDCGCAQLRAILHQVLTSSESHEDKEFPP
jgi:DNA-binding NarL/FixJ family response regulator